MASSFHHGYGNVPPTAPYAGYANNVPPAVTAPYANNVPPVAKSPYGYENMAPMAAPVGCAPAGGEFSFILVVYVLLVIISRI